MKQQQSEPAKGKKATFKILNFKDADDFYMHLDTAQVTSKLFWRFGEDNCFPDAVALLNRRSPIHRGILNSKVGYLTSRRMICDEKNLLLAEFIKNCDGRKTNLRELARRVFFDKKSFGNAYIEIVYDPSGNWINLFHQSAIKCRLARDKKSILLMPTWQGFQDSKKDKIKKVAIYPDWSDDQNTGFRHSVIHIKENEPGFENYGLMDWFAGMRVSAIAYKTNKWNISRLDNSFHASGVLVIDGDFDSDEKAEAFQTDAENEFTGEDNQGKVIAITKTKGDGSENGSKFIPLTLNYDGDWSELQAQSITELIIAHSWFRALTSLPDSTGFDTKRIINEYNVALNTVILDEQETMLNVFKTVINDLIKIDTEDLAFLNMPPVTEKPGYMKIWEARKADGLEYDEKDPAQNIYIAELTKQQKNAE